MGEHITAPPFLIILLPCQPLRTKTLPSLLLFLTASQLIPQKYSIELESLTANIPKTTMLLYFMLCNMCNSRIEADTNENISK